MRRRGIRLLTGLLTGLTIGLLAVAFSLATIGAGRPAWAEFPAPIPGQAVAPFTLEQNWMVCRGYNGGSFEYAGAYSLGLSPDCVWGSGDKPVVAMKDATFVSYRSDYGIACLNTADGGSIEYGGLKALDSLVPGARVLAGQRIGAAGRVNELNVLAPRLRVTAYGTPGCAGTSVPFDDAHHWRICGAPDLIATGPRPVGNEGLGNWGFTRFTASPCRSLASRPAIRGTLEVGVSAVPGQVTIKGWAYDPSDPTTSLEIRAYVGGNVGDFEGQLHTTSAGLARPDVEATFPAIGGHGFEATFDTDVVGYPGLYVYAYSRIDNTGKLLGTADLVIADATLRSAYEVAESLNPGGVRVKGAAYDPRAAAAYRIHAYVGAPSAAEGGEFHDLGLGSLSRPDLAASWSSLGRTVGFDATFATARTGTQPVYLYAVPDQAVPAMRPMSLGSKLVTIAPVPSTPVPAAIATVTASPSAPVIPSAGGRDDIPLVSVTTLTTLPAPASAGGGAGEVTATPIRVTLKATRPHRLRLDVDPDWPVGDYQLLVEKAKGKSWTKTRTGSTKGARALASLRLRPGRYRVTVARPGYATTVSKTVRVR